MRSVAKVLIVGAGAMFGCVWHYSPPAPVAVTSRSNFNAYAASFSYDTVQLAVDKQLLADSTLHNNGPLAEIQPMHDAYRADSSDMWGGVVLARIIVHPDTISWNSSQYAHYGINGPGTVYWFVRHGRSFFVPSDTAQAIDSTMTLDRGTTHKEDWRVSAARWRWSPNDEQPWVTCDKNHCCYAQ